MAKSRLSVVLLHLAGLLQTSFALPDADLDGPEPLRAFRMHGGEFLSNLTGVSDMKQDIFGRQACGAGYGQCDYTGECCPQNLVRPCCQKFCIGIQPAGVSHIIRVLGQC